MNRDAELAPAEVPLPGGNVGGAVLVGDTVRRPTGPWTPAVHELLDYLDAQGLPHIPRVLGIDEQGREILTYLPGEVVPIGERALTDAQLASAARWLRQYHRAVAGFPRGERRWRFVRSALAPGQIVCHHDSAMYNMAFDGDDLAGVFDWDVAGPGVPLDDLAMLAWNSPLLDLGTDPAAAAHGLVLIADAYGGPAPATILDHVFVRMTDACDRIEGGQRAGDPGMLRLGERDEPASTRQRLATLLGNRDGVAALLR
ncbi:phosphotransferase [Cellulomonas edaphi]|uniref:Aminoglycoside phosphotransferase family protein n=1 Tax=Cellulomonas edaphi TaxID=3053468 RepID=A0ABT7S7B6_9CELL|nr:aminoglycoside phosphotransferase family protein [Cellulomons edaphi]MDM7830824.1 aminoglycoside phosphotransferase family protein [Cellulomons edaphi]